METGVDKVEWRWGSKCVCIDVEGLKSRGGESTTKGKGEEDDDC